MRATTYNLVSSNSGQMIWVNPVSAKYFIEDKLCLLTAGSKQEL